MELTRQASLAAWDGATPLVLRSLVDPGFQPATSIVGDMTIATDTAPIYRDIPSLSELFVDDLFTETERNGELEVELDTDLLFDRLLQGQQVYRS